jgi:hypothetical protein
MGSRQCPKIACGKSLHDSWRADTIQSRLRSRHSGRSKEAPVISYNEESVPIGAEGFTPGELGGTPQKT